MGAFRLGNSIRAIAEALDLPIRSVYRWVSRFVAKGHNDRVTGSGRPSKTSKRAERRLDRLVKEDRFSASHQLLAAFKGHFHRVISYVRIFTFFERQCITRLPCMKNR